MAMLRCINEQRCSSVYEIPLSNAAPATRMRCIVGMIVIVNTSGDRVPARHPRGHEDPKAPDALPFALDPLVRGDCTSQLYR